MKNNLTDFLKSKGFIKINFILYKYKKYTVTLHKDFYLFYIDNIQCGNEFKLDDYSIINKHIKLKSNETI